MSKCSMFLCTLLLASCAVVGDNTFTGRSATFGGDNILRNDVFAHIQRWERLAFSCRSIRRADARINSLRRIDGRLQSAETWTVDACGKRHDYRIGLREDARGETDFTVSHIK